MTKKNVDKDISIEDSLKKLEKYVGTLESRDTSLDDSFKIFEEASKISLNIQKKLDSYERKIEIISENGDEIQLDPFQE